ncbi:MAG: asparagine synthetase B family protein, partial [Woeseia sp.]
RVTWAPHPEGLVFATSATAVAGFPGIEASLRQQALYDFLFMHMVPAPRTVYAGISKLPLATALQFDDGRVILERYWSPTYNYARASEFGNLKRSLREGLAAGVTASGVDKATGTFLSGGLDSSSVTGTLAGIQDGPARTFTVGFGEADYDELRFARTANKHFSCQPLEHQMRPADIVEAFPRIAAAYDEPFGNSSAAPTYFCAKLAAENGISHLLAGDGGDELFGGNERYIRHGVFEAYKHIPAWLRRSVIEPLVSPFSPEGQFMPLAKLRSYVDQARIPLPDRFESWNFMYREGGEQMLDPEFAASIDRQAPLKRMREVWESAPSDNRLERMLWYDWQFTLADNDLRKVGTMCELAGVRVSYPMLHPDVINLSLRVPPEMKIKGMELRHFFKKAMADFLPAEIIAKKKQGFGLPFGLWLKSDAALAEMIYSYLADLKKRRIIAAHFIDHLIAQHREGHASYFGYAIWDLAMLEAWLAAHTGRY